MLSMQLRLSKFHYPSISLLKTHPLLAHHLPSSSPSLYQSFLLQSHLRTCSNIKEIILTVNNHLPSILSPNLKIATVLLQFLNQFYIHPYNLNYNQDNVRKVYETLEKIPYQKYGIYQLTLKLSIYNKIIVYYTEHSGGLLEKWRGMVSRAERQIIDKFGKKRAITQQMIQSDDLITRKKAQNHRMDFIDAFNLMTSASFILNEKIVHLSLQYINEIILQDFAQSKTSNSKFLFIIVKKLNQVSWSKIRKYSNILKCLVSNNLPYQNPHNPKAYSIFFINLSSLKLHLVGQRIIPPLLSKLLSFITQNLPLFPQRTLLQILSCFKHLPPSFQSDSLHTILQFLKNSYISTHYFLQIPYTRLSQQQIDQIFEKLIRSETQKIWQDGVYFLNNWECSKWIFNKRICHAVENMYIQQIRQQTFAIIRDAVLYINFASALEARGMLFTLNSTLIKDTKVTFFKAKTPGEYSYSVVAIQIFLEFAAKTSQKLMKTKNYDHKTASVKGNQLLLQNFSIRNIFVLLQMIKSAQIQSKNPQQQQNYSILFSRICGIVPTLITRRQRRIVFNNFKKQVAQALTWFRSIKNYHIKQCFYILMCYMILREDWRLNSGINDNKKNTSYDKNDSKSGKIYRNWDEFNSLKQSDDQQLQPFFSKLSSKLKPPSESSSEMHFQQFPTLFTPDITLNTYLNRIAIVPAFNFDIYPQILFQINSRSFGLKQGSSTSSQKFPTDLTKILLSKLKNKEEQSTFLQLFLKDDTNQSLQNVRNFLHFLLQRNGSLRNVVMLLTGLDKYREESFRNQRGAPIPEFIQWISYYRDNQELMRQNITGVVINQDQSQSTNLNVIDIISANQFIQLLLQLKDHLPVIKFVKKFLQIYIQVFPLDQIFNRDVGTENNIITKYQHAYSLLSIASEILTIKTQATADEKSTNKQQKVQQQQQEQQKQLQNGIQSESITKYSLKPSFEESFPATTWGSSKPQLIAQSKLIVTLLRKLRNSLYDTFIFYPISPPTHELLIFSHLTTILQVPSQLRQHLVDQILLNNTQLSIKNFTPSRQKLLAIGKVFNYAILLKLYCIDKIDMEDRRLEFMRIMSELDVANRGTKGDKFQAKLDLRLWQSVFSCFPITFIKEVTKVHHYNGSDSVTALSNLTKFHQLLLPLLQQSSKTSPATLTLFSSAIYFLNLTCQLSRYLLSKSYPSLSFSTLVKNLVIHQILPIEKPLFNQLSEVISALEHFRIFDDDNLWIQLRNKLESQDKEFVMKQQEAQILKLLCTGHLTIQKEISPERKKWAQMIVQKCEKVMIEMIMPIQNFILKKKQSKPQIVPLENYYLYIWCQFYLNTQLETLEINTQKLLNNNLFVKLLKFFLSDLPRLFQTTNYESMFKNDWQMKRCLIECRDLSLILLSRPEAHSYFAGFPIPQTSSLIQKLIFNFKQKLIKRYPLHQYQYILQAVQSRNFKKVQIFKSQIDLDSCLYFQTNFSQSQSAKSQTVMIFPLKPYHFDHTQSILIGQFKTDVAISLANIKIAQTPKQALSNIEVWIFDYRKLSQTNHNTSDLQQKSTSTSPFSGIIGLTKFESFIKYHLQQLKERDTIITQKQQQESNKQQKGEKKYKQFY